MRLKSGIGLATILAVVAPVAMATGPLSAVQPAKPKSAAAIETVRAAVADTFSREPGYRPGDLITRKQVEKALASVDKAAPGKLKNDDRDKLVKGAIDDGSFLAEQLKSPEARSFMRRVGTMPGGYDLLDQLSQMEQGRSTVSRLVRGPDGYKLLEYMLQSKGGAELKRMLAKDPGNAAFGKPTGKIYTAEQLTASLEKLVGR